MFATGIENSYPTINQGRTRQDELEKCRFYENWKTDFQLVQDLGIKVLRFGPPLHRVWLGDGRYDWDMTDQMMAELKRLDIAPIVDLCHFGLPDWVGNFQNGDFPALFARYAQAFAQRFPWVQLYTPVNEMYVCAMFSARYGWWNEQLSSDQAFVTALKHIVRANVMAMTAILNVRPDVLFIQSESSEYFHPETPQAIGPSARRNAERFLSLDLNYGYRVDSQMYDFLMDNGMSRQEYDFFHQQNLRPHCIMGNDYYKTNEHRVAADGSTSPAGEVFGYSQITQQYYDRYKLPVMHTETNLWQGPDGDEAVYWLWKEWSNVAEMRARGIPILGFTWFSLTDQVDWDTALRENNGNVNPLGLYDLDRKIRPVGTQYKALIAEWADVLPMQSVCLIAPISKPSEAASDWVKDMQTIAARVRQKSLGIEVSNT